MRYSEVRGVRVSKITLGTAQLGMNYGIANRAGKPDRAQSFEILERAVEGGINSFDTAASYGESEAMIGDFFAGRGTGRARCAESIDRACCEEDTGKTCRGNGMPLVTTKFKVQAEDGACKTDAEKFIYSYAEKSLENLKQKRIPIFMLHSAGDMDKYGTSVDNALRLLKRDGIIDKAGVSVYTPEEADMAVESGLYEAVQIPMNLFDGRMLESSIIDRLKEREIITFVRSVFLQGVFFMQPDELAGKLAPLGKALRGVHSIAEKAGCSIACLAFSYICGMEGVTSLVIGAETSVQMAENLRLMDFPPVAYDYREELAACIKDIPVELLNPVNWK